LNKTQKIAKEKYLQDGDVLVNSTGTGTLGRVAQYKEIDGSIFCDSHVSIVRANELIDKEFLAHQLSHKEPMIENYGKGATNQIELSSHDLGLLKINLPPLPTQQKIAKILSNYDDLIENNLKRIKLLEESARLTYEEWFLRFRIDGKKLEIDPESDLPFGWEKISLSDTGEFLNGYAFKPKDLQEEGLPVIKIKEMKAGVVEDTPRNPGDKIDDKYLVLRGDILFSWSATLEVIQWQYANGWLNQHLFKVSPNSDFPKSFLYLSLRNSLYIFDYLTTGATMKHIKRKELDFVKIPTPSSDILLKFDNLVNPMLEEILNLSHQNQLLKEARDILLPRLMTGMIDTDNMDIAV
jgi:type I restriction enzyme S subunit